MILIPEQVQEIRKKLETAKLEKIKYDEYYEDTRAMGGTDEESKFIVSDSSIKCQDAINKVEIIKLSNALLSGVYLKDIDTTKIDIGTKFYLRFDDEDEQEKFTLVDTLTGLSSANGYITKDSIVGKAIYGKSSGDKFSYQVNGRTITGKVQNIITNEDEYLQFITQRGKYQRSSKEYKNIHHMMLENKDLYSGELAKEEELTSSQLKILKEEFARLKEYVDVRKTIFKTGEYYRVASRLYCVGELLKNAKIASFPKDDSIGVGSFLVLCSLQWMV